MLKKIVYLTVYNLMTLKKCNAYYDKKIKNNGAFKCTKTLIFVLNCIIFPTHNYY